MKNKLGFGILGAGLVAPFHIRALQDANCTGGKAIAVCDIDQQRADKLAADFNITAYYSLDDMLNDPAIDVVNVATPNHLHHDAVIACAAAGKHVITEKPPAMSLADTDAMITACDKAGMKFACMVNCRVRAAIQAIKQAVDQGRFGPILHADTYMKWFRSTDYYKSDAWRSSRRSGAGVTVQQAFHYIDLLQYLVGPAQQLQAWMTNINHPEIKIEDTLLARVKWQCGALGVVQASTALWPGTDMRIEINGADGTAIMTGESITTWQFRDERPEDEQIRNLGNTAQATAAGGAADFGYADHQTVIQNVIDAIQHDHEVMIPVNSVRPTLEMVLAMYHSAAKNTPITLPVQDDESIWDM